MPEKPPEPWNPMTVLVLNLAVQFLCAMLGLFVGCDQVADSPLDGLRFVARQMPLTQLLIGSAKVFGGMSLFVLGGVTFLMWRQRLPGALLIALGDSGTASCFFLLVIALKYA